MGILIRQACEAVPAKGHYDRGLWESVEDGAELIDAPCPEGAEGARARCPESAPYSEGTRGTGGRVPCGT